MPPRGRARKQRAQLRLFSTSRVYSVEQQNAPRGTWGRRRGSSASPGVRRRSRMRIVRSPATRSSSAETSKPVPEACSDLPFELRLPIRRDGLRPRRGPREILEAIRLTQQHERTIEALWGKTRSMATAIVTGSGGLIGSESVQYFVEQGFDVVGLENDCVRASAPTLLLPGERTAGEAVPDEFRWIELDIRDADGVMNVFREAAGDLELIVHTAAQPFTIGLRATRRRISESTRTGRSTCLRRPASTSLTRPSSSARQTRSTATVRISSRWRSSKQGWSCRRSTSTTAVFRRRCRSTSRCTRCSVSPRRRRI